LTEVRDEGSGTEAGFFALDGEHHHVDGINGSCRKGVVFEVQDDKAAGGCSVVRVALAFQNLRLLVVVYRYISLLEQ